MSVALAGSPAFGNGLADADAMFAAAAIAAVEAAAVARNSRRWMGSFTMSILRLGRAWERKGCVVDDSNPGLAMLL